MKKIILLLLISQSICFSQKKNKIIQILSADEIKGGKHLMYKRLLGNVKFKHEGILMRCDSAHFNSHTNVVEAFSRVKINQGDSIFTHSDYISYDGNTKLAKLKYNVKLKDPTMTLTTDSLEFNRFEQKAYYINKGKVVDSTNILTSNIGYYYIRQKKVRFLKDVKVISNNTKIYSDTLDYYSVNKNIELFGNSTIKNKKYTIKCTHGLYKTKEKLSFLNQKPLIIYDNKTLQSDSIYLDKTKGFISLNRNIQIIDTLHKLVLKGHYAELFQKQDSCFITKKAIAINVLEKDSLYLHSDTIMLLKKNNQTIVKSYNQVKFFKSNLQGKCDSIHFNQSLGIMQMIKNPIVWANKNQMTSDLMILKIDTIKSKVDSIKMLKNAFVTSRDTLTNFNQIKGKNIYGKIKEQGLDKAFVEGNAQIIYYARNNKKKLIGVNKSICSSLKIKFSGKKIKQITYFDEPDSFLYPLSKFKKKDRKLRGFKWLGKQMILTKDDIFKKSKKISLKKNNNLKIKG